MSTCNFKSLTLLKVLNNKYMKISIKKAVWKLMDEKGYASDQEIVNLIGREPLDWRTIEIYKTA